MMRDEEAQRLRPSRLWIIDTPDPHDPHFIVIGLIRCGLLRWQLFMRWSYHQQRSIFTRRYWTPWTAQWAGRELALFTSGELRRRHRLEAFR